MRLDEGRRKANTDLVVESRIPEGTSYLDRIDPLYEVPWTEAMLTRWERVSVLSHVLKPNAVGVVVHADTLRHSPVDISPARRYTPVAIRTVAVLAQYHQASTYQLAALLGVSVARAYSAASLLHAFGVVERGIPKFSRERDGRPHGGCGSIWRLDLDGDRLAAYLDGLTDLEYSLVSGGRDLTKGARGATSASSIRHNLMTLEIVLRALEVSPALVGGWGEPSTTAELLLPPGRRVEERIRANVADAAVVTRGGALVVFEVSGAANVDAPSVSAKLAGKAAAWTAVAARTELDLRIVFVDVSQRPKPNRFRWHVKRGVEESDRYLSRATDRERGATAVFVADAHDWFPLPLGISAGFRTLGSWSPVTNRIHDVLPSTPESVRVVDSVVNTLASLHTPDWITADPVSLLSH